MKPETYTRRDVLLQLSNFKQWLTGCVWSQMINEYFADSTEVDASSTLQ